MEPVLDPLDDENPAGREDALMPLGDLQKGSIDILEAVVNIRDNPDRPVGVHGLEWIIRIETPNSRIPFEVAAPSQSEALLWADKIRDTSRSASFREESNRKKERALRIARELSNLVIYCRSVVFNLIGNRNRRPPSPSESTSIDRFKPRRRRRVQRAAGHTSGFPSLFSLIRFTPTIRGRGVYVWSLRLAIRQV